MLRVRSSVPFGPLVLGVCLWSGLAWGTSNLAPAPGESLALRWVRKLAEHPIRGPLALGLLGLAARRARRSSPRAEPTVESRAASG